MGPSRIARLPNEGIVSISLPSETNFPLTFPPVFRTSSRDEESIMRNLSNHRFAFIFTFLLVTSTIHADSSITVGKVHGIDVLRRANRSTVEILAWARNPQFVEHSRGAGVVLSAAGYIVTANHVVRGYPEIEVRTPHGPAMKAELVATEEELDIAILKVRVTTVLEPASVASSERIQSGRKAIVIGNPGGMGQSVISGKLGGTRVVSWDGNKAPLRSIEADVVPGNSGGGAFDVETGELLGITVAKSSTQENIGYVVPADQVAEIAASYVSIGELSDAREVAKSLGVTLRPVSLVSGEFTNGLLVTHVKRGSAAATAGWREGDIIVGLSKYHVKSASDIVYILQEADHSLEGLSFLAARDHATRVGTVAVDVSRLALQGPALAQKSSSSDRR
jgi:S1-C subfamily serine protease